jgi:hypothetical protein
MELKSYEKGDYGIALADASCSGDLRNEGMDKQITSIIREIRGEIYHYEVDMEEVLKEILYINDFAWTREEIPIIDTLQSMRDEKRKKEYTASRDAYTVDRKGQSVNIWQQTSIEHAGKINSAKGIESKVKATKTQFDWVKMVETGMWTSRLTVPCNNRVHNTKLNKDKNGNRKQD